MRGDTQIGGNLRHVCGAILQYMPKIIGNKRKYSLKSPEMTLKCDIFYPIVQFSILLFIDYDVFLNLQLAHCCCHLFSNSNNQL